MNKVDLLVYIKHYTMLKEKISVIYGTFTKIDHVLSYKEDISKF